MISRAKIRIISETKKKKAGKFRNPSQVVLLLILADDLVLNLHNSKIFVKAVKTFDHLYFLVLIKHKNIAIRELVWIVFYCLIDLFGLHPIQVSNITI